MVMASTRPPRAFSFEPKGMRATTARIEANAAGGASLKAQVSAELILSLPRSLNRS